MHRGCAGIDDRLHRRKATDADQDDDPCRVVLSRVVVGVARHPGRKAAGKKRGKCGHLQDLRHNHVRPVVVRPECREQPFERGCRTEKRSPRARRPTAHGRRRHGPAYPVRRGFDALNRSRRRDANDRRREELRRLPETYVVGKELPCLLCEGDGQRSQLQAQREVNCVGKIIWRLRSPVYRLGL